MPTKEKNEPVPSLRSGHLGGSHPRGVGSPDNLDKRIQEVADKIVREFQPEKIILFGSYAWGNPGPDSDVDLFVVKETQDPSLKRIEALDRIFSRREFPMDFLVYTPAQVQKRMEIGDFFMEEIMSKGQILYERPK